MPAKNAGDAAKAFRLRKKRDAGQTLKPLDALWLADFEEEQQRDPKRRKGTKSYGASASGKRVRLEIDEHAEAVGTGSAAAEAATAALMVKEEGRRLDSLTINAVAALQAAVATYKEICLSLKDRQEIIENTHVEMLQAWRAEFLRGTDLESELREKAAKGDDNEMLTMLLPIVAAKLGVEIPGLGNTKRAPRK